VHWAASDDLCWFATADERPLHLIGRLATEPEIVPPGAPNRLQPFVAGAVSYVVIDPREVRTSWGALTVRGRSRVRVLGDLVHVHAGDLVELHGRFRLPPTPGNPGEFDAAAWLRRNGIRTVIDVSHPAHVVRLAPGRDIAGKRWRAAQQRRLADGLLAHLGERLAPVAVALLLGPRSQIDAEIYDAFESTGTLHLLAISGINVALLAGFLWSIGRIAGVSPTATNIFTAALLIAMPASPTRVPPWSEPCCSC
jgi:competence protein ComEC